MLPANFFPVLLFSDLWGIDTKGLLKFTKLLRDVLWRAIHNAGYEQIF